MGLSSLMVQLILQDIGPALKKLLKDNPEEFKKLYDDLSASLTASMKLITNPAAQLPKDFQYRKMILDCMSMVYTSSEVIDFMHKDNTAICKKLHEMLSNKTQEA